MGEIIFELGLSILCGMYIIVDILIPSFSSKEYFWFAKSFKGKPKATFEQEVKTAEKAYADAKQKMEHLKDSANEESKEAEKHLEKTEEVLKNAKEKLKKFTK